MEAFLDFIERQAMGDEIRRGNLALHHDGHYLIVHAGLVGSEVLKHIVSTPVQPDDLHRLIHQLGFPGRLDGDIGSSRLLGEHGFGKRLSRGIDHHVATVKGRQFPAPGDDVGANHPRAGQSGQLRIPLANQPQPLLIESGRREFNRFTISPTAIPLTSDPTSTTAPVCWYPGTHGNFVSWETLASEDAALRPHAHAGVDHPHDDIFRPRIGYVDFLELHPPRCGKYDRF